MKRTEEDKLTQVSGIRYGENPVPPLLKGVYVVLVIWAVAYGVFMPGKLVESNSNVEVSEDYGRKIFEGTCMNCHTTGAAPDLAGVMERYKPEEVDKIIREGRNTMPALETRFDETARLSVIEYLKTY